MKSVANYPELLQNRQTANPQSRGGFVRTSFPRPEDHAIAFVFSEEAFGVKFAHRFGKQNREYV